MSRPDISIYLAHFTSHKFPKGRNNKENPTNEFMYTPPIKRLENILREKTIRASILPWTNDCKAVCLTECPWTSLIEHTKQYSPFGIGFSKKFIFAAGGAPVYYVRADHFDKQEWNSFIKTFTTPFWPSYVTKKQQQNKDFKLCDYSHEREWRVAHDLTFDYTDIEFVILKDYKSMAMFPQDLKDAIGRDKFLLMDNYTRIEELWPVHNL